MSTLEVSDKNIESQTGNTKSSISWLLKLLSVLIFFLIAVGGLVRNLDAGLACPDWPLCHDKIIPHFDVQIFAEYFHRVFAGLISLLTLFISILIAKDKRLRSMLGQLSLLALTLLISQVILGGLTVLKLLKSEIVTLHLAAGTLYFLIVLIMTLRAHRFGDQPHLFTIARDRKREDPSGTWRIAIGASIAVYIQIILGGMVASNYAGVACPDFPTCHGMWWPGLDGIIGIQILHRLGALFTFIIVLGFAYKSLKNTELPKHIHNKTIGVVALLIIQISLGIGNVLFLLPVALSVAHLVVAEALFALIVMCTYEIRHFQLR
ncbi:MAG: COX15/CtaA family protein [Oligoflexia bacterium]|nr:COX15/CtaA family protein [Oligoflexia bacterium]